MHGSLPPAREASSNAMTAGVSVSTHRARGMGFDALAALSDYAKALMRRDDARTRGLAAHTAGRAVLDLAAYAEELEVLVQLYAEGEGRLVA